MLNLWDLRWAFITVYDLFIFLYIYYFRTASWWSLCGGVVTTATPNTFRPMKLHYAVLGPWTLKDLRPLPSEPASPWGNKWSLAQRKQTGERERRKERAIKTKRQREEDLRHCSLLDYRIQSTDGVKESQQQDLRIGKITSKTIKRKFHNRREVQVHLETWRQSSATVAQFKVRRNQVLYFAEFTIIFFWFKLHIPFFSVYVLL